MNADNLFLVTNLIALLAWMLLIIIPRWKVTHLLVINGSVSLLLAIIYSSLIIGFFHQADGSYHSLQGVSKLFQHNYILLAGWIHYLAFDLLIGSWIVQDASKHNIPRIMIIPCLILTFLFGPAGFLTYIICRRIYRHYKKPLENNKINS